MSSPVTPFKSAPSTPSKATTPTTGSWRHPAMDIVAKRNSEKAFTDNTFHRLMLNSIALFLMWFVPAFIRQFPSVAGWILSNPILTTYTFYALYAVRAVCIWNVLEAVFKLLSPADEFTDIPLTPQQRKLLGLNPDTPLTPAAAAAASGGGIVTPPRYTKSTPSSRTGSPNFSISTGSPSMSRNVTATPPPVTPSPLRMGGGGVDRRSSGSFGSPVFGGSPAAGGKVGGSSVVPGNKWLYEKNLQRKTAGLGFSPGKNVFSPRPAGL